MCDYEEAFARTMKSQHPDVTIVPAEKRLSWDITKDYPASVADKVKSVNGVPGFFENMKANEGAVEAVKAMADAGHNVLIVTAPDPSFYAQCSQEKYNWVEEHYHAGNKLTVLVARDKTTVRGDFLIDDKPTCDVGSMKPEWQHVVFDQTYNKAKAGAKRLTSWSAWKDVLGVKAVLDCAAETNPRQNQESIVRKTLAGLVQQKIKSNFKFEVIIVDNNSTDDIDAIYKKYRTQLDLTLVQRRKLANTFSV